MAAAGVGNGLFILVAREDLRSRLLVGERLERNCLNTHCDG